MPVCNRCAQENILFLKFLQLRTRHRTSFIFNSFQRTSLTRRSFVSVPYKNAGLRGHNSVNNFYVDQYVEERGCNP